MKSKLNLLWALPWGITSWLLVELLVFTPIFLVGLVLMLPLLLAAPITLAESRVNAGQTIAVFEWSWAQTIWGNWEDGLAPAWWIATMPTAPMWWIRYQWYLRNPDCNMRFWPLVSTLPSPDVEWCGPLTEVPASGVPGWFVAWQMPYVGFYWACSTWGIWAGWKLNPRDAQPNAPTDYRYFGLGTACQLLRF